MAAIRKRNNRWQVQVRRKGFASVTKSFLLKSHALEWAREIERQADRQELPTCRKVLDGTCLRGLVVRYRDEILPEKKSAAIETIILNAFLKDRICQKKLSELTAVDFAKYRDRRLQEITPSSLKRQLALACPQWVIRFKC